jgi:hypothetical protein
VQQQLVQQDAEGQHRLNLDREQVLNRLWEIANLSPEMTRNSITGQVKALSMIIAMENFIPACPGVPWDRRAGSAEKKSTPAPVNAQVYEAAWLRRQKAETIAPQPSPAPPVPACRGAQQEDAPGIPEPASDSVAEPALSEVEWAPPVPAPTQPAFAHRVPLADGVPPYVPQSTFVPDTRVPFSIKVNPFKYRR